MVVNIHIRHLALSILYVPTGVAALGYVDDLVLFITASNKYKLITNGNEAPRKLNKWLVANKLQLVPSKTDAVIFKGKRRGDHVESTIVIPKKIIKYLGIVLDQRL